MTSPYINTILHTTVSVLPNQMDNNIYTNMKNNLIGNLKGRCYKKYGFIADIYEILSYGDALIEAENPFASALFNVKFSCRLCMPILKKYIICKVDRIIPMLVHLINGPIRVIVTNDRINKDKFIIGKYGILVKSQDANIKTKPLQMGDIVKIQIDSRSFNNKDTIIMCMGILEDLATKEDIDLFYSDEFNKSENFIDYEKYMNENQQDINI